MNSSYIATNIEELLDTVPEDIGQIIDSDEVTTTAATIGKIYKIQMEAYLPLSNVIYLTLISAIHPENVVTALQDIVSLSPEIAHKVAEDLDKSILKKAHISLFNENNGDVATLTFTGEPSHVELRKEILDTTKRDEAVHPNKTTPQTLENPKKQTVLAPGSRSQLLEQLQHLGAIPKDDEVEARLSHIKEQIQKIDGDSPRENTLDNNVPLKEFMFGEKGKDVVDPIPKSATYSKAPTRYNVDPYREVAGN